MSNICEDHYLGIDDTLKIFAPLLQTFLINRHATLVTLFLNSIDEMRMLAQHIPIFVDCPFRENQMEQTKKVLQYMPELGRRVSHPYHPTSIKLIVGLSLVHDMEKHFNRYVAGYFHI